MQDERRGFGETSPRRPHTNGNGFRSESTRIRPVPFSAVSDEPIDLVAVQADDELISALAAGMSVSSPGVGGYDADDQVVAMLAAWRAEVDAEPLPELVDLDTATATVLAAARPARRARHLVPLAAAAAMLVFTIGGVSIGASEARPGDVLWDVSKVLYSERAESVEAAGRVEARIDAAKSALARGEPAVAAQVLNEAEQDFGVIRAEEGLVELAELKSFLEAKAAETPPGRPTQPGSPLASDPTRPVPPRAGTTEPLTTAPSPSVVEPTEPPEDVAVEPEVSPSPSDVEPSPEDEPSTDPSSTAVPPEDTEGVEDATENNATPTAEGDADETSTPGPGFGSSRPDVESDTPAASGTTTSESAPTS